MNLKLSRPIVFFDIESTGIDVAKDRIIEISMIKVYPEGLEENYTWRVNPGIPIPDESRAIHGISDEDVKDKPPFEDIASKISALISDSDLAGYNCNKFDIPILAEELLRAGYDFDTNNKNIVDVQNIFHKMEPRTLVAAYQFYCGKNLEDAHSAHADTLATYEVLKAQLDKYSNTSFTDKNGQTSTPVINDMKALADFTGFKNNADLKGHIAYNDKGDEVFNFGKHKGKKVEDVFKKEPQYYDWMMHADFPQYTKKIITAIKLRDFNKGASKVE